MRKVLYIAGGVVVLAVAGVVGIWWAAPGWVEKAGSWMTASATSEAVGSRDEERRSQKQKSRSTEDRAEKPRGPYEPTSGYVAEGFDPDEQALDFSESKARTDSESRLEVLTANDVQEILYDRASQLIPCYQKVLDERPKAKGNVQFEFGIDAEGEVLMVRVTDSELRSEAAEDCMVEKTKHWQFPKTNLSVPTRFETGMVFRLR